MNHLRQFLLDNGANEVGYADISDVTPKKGLDYGIVFYMTYPREIIRTIRDAPSIEYLKYYDYLNDQLDDLGLLCEEYLIEHGFKAYAQTRKRLGMDFGEDNSFELPHKTIATRAGLGWIGKSALFVTGKYGSALRLISVLTDAPLDCGTPILESSCGKCMTCTQTCPAEAISGLNWSVELNRNDFYDDRKCEEYAHRICLEKFSMDKLICGKCIYECPHTQKYILK